MRREEWGKSGERVWSVEGGGRSENPPPLKRFPALRREA